MKLADESTSSLDDSAFVSREACDRTRIISRERHTESISAQPVLFQNKWGLHVKHEACDRTRIIRSRRDRERHTESTMIYTMC